MVTSDTGEGTLIDFEKPYSFGENKGKTMLLSNEIKYDG